MRKSIATLILASLLSNVAISQSPRRVIVEHFTNTKCSICASKNPTFYNTLHNYSDVLYISYHPSAPYVACVFSMENKVENDARTNYYGVYGGTPRVAIQGKVIPSKTPSIDATDIDTMRNKYSPVELNLRMTRINTDSIQVSSTVLTTASHNYNSLGLYVAVTEDTIYYTGPNGEPVHYGVFHKQLYAGNGLKFSPAGTVGDSVMLVTGFRISGVDSIRNTDRINVIGMVQDSATKFIVQAAKQTIIETPGTVNTGIEQSSGANSFEFYPNPTSGEVFFTTDESKQVMISDATGQVVRAETNIGKSLNVSELSNGFYYLQIANAKGEKAIKRMVVVNK